MKTFEERMTERRNARGKGGSPTQKPACKMGGIDVVKLNELVNKVDHNALVAVIQSDMIMALNAIDAPKEVWSSPKLLTQIFGILESKLNSGTWNLELNIEWAKTDLMDFIDDNEPLWKTES